MILKKIDRGKQKHENLPSMLRANKWKIPFSLINCSLAALLGTKKWEITFSLIHYSLVVLLEAKLEL